MKSPQQQRRDELNAAKRHADQQVERAEQRLASARRCMKDAWFPCKKSRYQRHIQVLGVTIQHRTAVQKHVGLLLEMLLSQIAIQPAFQTQRQQKQRETQSGQTHKPQQISISVPVDSQSQYPRER